MLAAQMRKRDNTFFDYQQPAPSKGRPDMARQHGLHASHTLKKLRAPLVSRNYIGGGKHSVEGTLQMARATASPILQLIRRVVEDPQVRELPDPDLLQRFRSERDDGAFHTLLRRHGPMVLDVCRGVLGDSADADDAFQATFLVLAQKAGSIRKDASLGSWLHGVASRTALKARAQCAARQKHRPSRDRAQSVLGEERLDPARGGAPIDEHHVGGDGVGRSSAERDGTLTPGSILVESSSGNLGVALSMIAASKGYRFVCVTDARCNVATRRLMEALGSEVHVITEPSAESQPSAMPSTSFERITRLMSIP